MRRGSSLWDLPISTQMNFVSNQVIKHPTEVIKHYKVGFAHWLYSSEAVFVGTKLAEMFT